MTGLGIYSLLSSKVLNARFCVFDWAIGERIEPGHVLWRRNYTRIIAQPSPEGNI